MKSKNLLVITGLFLGVFVIGADSFIISPLLPNIAMDFQASISQAAFGVTAYALCEMIGAPLFGPLGDRFSKRKLLLLGISIFLIGTLLCALSPNLISFYIFRAIAGFGAALFLPNVWAFIGGYFEVKTMNKVMGIVMSALSLSVALGVPLGSFLAQLSSWQMAFWASAVLSVLSGLVILLVIPNTLPSKTKLHYTSAFKKIFMMKKVPQVLSISFFYMFSFYTIYTFLGSYLTNTFHFSLTQRGFVFFTYGLVNFIAAIFGGSFMNKVGRENSILFNSAASVILALGLGILGQNFPLLIISLILLAITMGLGVTAISALIVTTAPQNRSTIMSFNSSVLYLGLTLASALGGIIYQTHGFPPLAFSSAFGFLLALCFIWRIKNSEKF
ncbi:MAG: MFS transporter [Streptococcaceae bacterium]|jgi:multidrug resistance protein|nr:MFS transporter [Streptococcaceae bacterium]